MRVLNIFQNLLTHIKGVNITSVPTIRSGFDLAGEYISDVGCADTNLAVDTMGKIARTYVRKPYSSNVTFEHQGKTYRGAIKDLSLGGAFIETTWANHFSVGDVVKVQIPFSKGSKLLKRNVVIRRINAEGFGVEFM